MSNIVSVLLRERDSLVFRKLGGGRSDAVYFQGALNARATEIAEYLNKKIAEQKSSTTPISAADEIRKFKALLDEDVISQEEFDAKKKELLK